MSHFEMKNKGLTKILIAACIATATVLPVNSYGAIEFTQNYFRGPASMRAPASINRVAISLVAPSRVFYGEDGKSLSPELIANFNLVKLQEKPMDTAQMIPTDMKPSDNSSEVFSKVADKSVASLMNSEAIRETAFGRAATQVEERMKAQVLMGGNSPKSIQHKLNFNMQAFQATAQVQYTGFTNANLKYKIAENKLGLEVFERVTRNKDLVMSHTISTLNRLSEISLRWNF